MVRIYQLVYYVMWRLLSENRSQSSNPTSESVLTQNNAVGLLELSIR